MKWVTEKLQLSLDSTTASTMNKEKTESTGCHHISINKSGVCIWIFPKLFHFQTQLFSWIKFLLGFLLHPKMSVCVSPSVIFSCMWTIFHQCYGEYTAQVTDTFPPKVENYAVHITMSWHRYRNPGRTEILKQWRSGLHTNTFVYRKSCD